MMSCPSAATLARLGIGSVHDETLSTIEEHIACCAECQAELNRLMQNDGAGAFSPSLPTRDALPRLPGFLIERELGRGSMSVVYLARQPSLSRLVALKIVQSGPTAGSRDYARWLREGRSFSLLRHENVVRLHDIGEAEGWLYLVLEYIPGGTLNDRLDVPYAGDDAARLLAAIADAVEAIHRTGLLHLDLKPSNILMDAAPGAPRERAIPRVGDFGLAYLWDDPDATSNTIAPIGMVGTPRYMAPEQGGAGRDRLGPATDVHGLGALLYHAITGRPPFAGSSVAETLDQVRDQEPVPPRRLNPAIPRDLETICLKCLRKEPAHRYASAQAVADDLRRFLERAPIAARPASPAEKAWRWCRRRPAVASLAAALVLVLWGGFLGMFLLWRHAEAQRARAEAAQNRAEDDTRRAAELLGQLVEVNVGGRDNLPTVVSPEQTIARLRVARRNLIELADRLPDREAMLRQRMAVDLRLGRTLREESRWVELRSMYEGSLRDAEGAIQQFPRAGFARGWLVEVLNGLAEAAAKEKRADDQVALLARTVAGAEDWYAAAPGTDALLSLVTTRRSLAMVLATRGRRAEAGDLLLANRCALRDVPADWLDEEVVAALALNAMIFWHLGIELPPKPRVEGACPLGAIAVLGSPETDRMPPDAWAKTAARALRFDDPDRPATFRESRAAWRFSSGIQSIASDQRTRGPLDRAGQIADRFLAFARLLVERNPDDPIAHLVLAEAYDQVGKNAWQVDDRATIRLTLMKAIEENLRALDKTPYDEVARHQLERRQRKLDELLHPPAKAQTGQVPPK